MSDIFRNPLKGIRTDIFGPVDAVFVLSKQFCSMLDLVYEDWPDFSKYGKFKLEFKITTIDYHNCNYFQFFPDKTTNRCFPFDY